MESSDADEAWCIAGMHHVILHTIGRKSGNEHKVALPYWVDRDGNRVVVASFSGAPEHPSLVPQPERPRRQPRGEDPGAGWRVLGRRAGARRRRLRRDLGCAQRRPPLVRRLPEPHRPADPAGASRRAPLRLTASARQRSWTSPGIIFASVDCDADAVEDWNRWYDLEHLPPNIALPGIMSGKRYVAPPELHEVREPADRLEGFADGRGVHVTVYTLSGDPAQVLADMTSTRDVLEDAGRMFAPEKKIVRAGDAMTLSWGVADPALKADPIDVPHMQHTVDPCGDAARR